MRLISKIFAIAALAVSCAPLEEKPRADFSVTPNVILDTDIGNSLDDLLALDILHHFRGQGKVRLLAVMVNHDVPLAPQAMDVVNTWYGAGQTPIGMVSDGVKDSHIWEDYAPLLCGCKSYWRTLTEYSSLPDAVTLYRRILAESQDKSVTILSIGFMTNLGRLLESGPDEYSAMSGAELVRSKVRSIVAMCGSQNEAEYNIANDIPSARTVFEKTPVPMSIVPGETQIEVTTKDINDNTGWAYPHPVALGYTTHSPDDMNMCWDAIAALAFVNGFSDVTISAPCDAVIGSNGIMDIKENASGSFRLLSLSPEQQKKNKALLLSILNTGIK